VLLMPVYVRSHPGSPAIVEAYRACSEMHDLEQSTRDPHVLEELDHHVLIGEVAMEEDCRHDAPDR
jgi:hypothetical protein